MIQETSAPVTVALPQQYRVRHDASFRYAPWRIDVLENETSVYSLPRGLEGHETEGRAQHRVRELKDRCEVIFTLSSTPDEADALAKELGTTFVENKDFWIESPNLLRLRVGSHGVDKAKTDVLTAISKVNQQNASSD